MVPPSRPRETTSAGRMSGLTWKSATREKKESCSSTPRIDDRDEAGEDLRGDDHPRDPPVSTCTHVEVAQVGDRAARAPAGWPPARRSRPASTSPTGRLGGNSEASPCARQPAVTTVWPSWTRLDELMKSRIRSSGLPTSGLTTPWTAVRHDLGRDGARVVGDQGHLGGAAGDRGDLADQAVAVDHRVVDADAVAAADVDRHRRVPDGRRAGDRPAR